MSRSSRTRSWSPAEITRRRDDRSSASDAINARLDIASARIVSRRIRLALTDGDDHHHDVRDEVGDHDHLEQGLGDRVLDAGALRAEPERPEHDRDDDRRRS
jgi:hypothetical protein